MIQWPTISTFDKRQKQKKNIFKIVKHFAREDGGCIKMPMWNQMTFDYLPHNFENNVYTSFSYNKKRKKKEKY